MDAALSILAITGPIYLLIGLGYAVTRQGVFARTDMPVLGKFVIQLALPALLFNALSQRPFAEVFNAQYLAANALASLALQALAWTWARRVRGHSPSYASMVAMGMTCPNSGFVGYPVMLLTLGASTAGVALALNMMVENFLLLPLLMALADRQNQGAVGAGAALRQAVRQTLLGVLRNPMVWGIVAGALWSLSGWVLPAPLARSLHLLAGASGALSLFVIGGSLAGLSLAGMRSTLIEVALGKLLLHPLMMLAVGLWLLPIDDPALRQALVLTGALPMLGIFTILSQRHGHGSVSAAALLVTTVLSFFSLNAWLWWVQQHLV